MLLRVRRPVAIGAGAPFQSDGGGEAGAPAPAAVRTSVFEVPPVGSTPIVARQVGQVNGVGNILQGIVSGVVPAGSVAVLQSIALVVNSPTIATSVYARLVVNGSVYPGLGQLALFGRNGAASLQDSWDALRVVLYANASWRLDVVDVDGALYNVEAAVIGYYMPRELAANG